ncbi:MAG: hypothetical protein F6K03_05315 [Kamptonema sp. SIO4C4]|nr:hypothetical protein [Kamptonema sp. SIO4C4]
MGTFYGLGLIRQFSTQRPETLTPQDLEAVVNERLNLELFDVTVTEDKLQGTIKPNLFSEYIEDFFAKLKAIAPNTRSVDYYLQEFGTEIDQYPSEWEEFKIGEVEEKSIKLSVTWVLLCLEGKVSAEEFSLEPALLNWLFRHSNFENPLAGAILSGIVG